MASLYTNIGNTTPIYVVLLNDGGSDGGSNSNHYVSPDVPTSFTDEQMQAALQAYADTLLSFNSSFSIVSISKNQVVSTDL